MTDYILFKLNSLENSNRCGSWVNRYTRKWTSLVILAVIDYVFFNPSEMAFYLSARCLFTESTGNNILNHSLLIFLSHYYCWTVLICFSWLLGLKCKQKWIDWWRYELLWFLRSTEKVSVQMQSTNSIKNVRVRNRVFSVAMVLFMNYYLAEVY